MLITIIIFIIILSILVFAHELGHFWTARKFGVKAEEFGLFFPPRIAGLYKAESGKWKKVFGSREVRDAKSTIYSINWLPLGGFVKIKGEQGEKRSEPDSFAFQKIWKRIVIISAGVAMNLILAAFLISVGFMVGLPQVIEDLPASAEVEGRNIQVMQVLENSPAAKAGLQMGDIILGINGRQFNDYEELRSFVNIKLGDELVYEIKRGANVLQFHATPEVLEETREAGIGVAVAEMGIVSYPWYQAIWEGVKATIFMTWFIIAALAMLLKDLILGQGAGADIAGPVGIAIMTGQVAELGFVYILQFAAILSINLAIINFLPFPALDGGRAIFLLLEKICGKAVPEKIEAAIHNFGFILLIILVLLVTYRDILRLF